MCSVRMTRSTEHAMNVTCSNADSTKLSGVRGERGSAWGSVESSLSFTPPIGAQESTQTPAGEAGHRAALHQRPRALSDLPSFACSPQCPGGVREDATTVRRTVFMHLEVFRRPASAPPPAACEWVKTAQVHSSVALPYAPLGAPVARCPGGLQEAARGDVWPSFRTSWVRVFYAVRRWLCRCPVSARCGLSNSRNCRLALSVGARQPVRQSAPGTLDPMSAPPRPSCHTKQTLRFRGRKPPGLRLL